MRFEEDVHWTDGLFLQPHHLQRMQYALHSRLRAERAALTPFPYGLVDFEIDEPAASSSSGFPRSCPAARKSACPGMR